MPLGKVIVSRYLVNTLRVTDLECELGKYKGKEAEIVRAAFLSTLCQSIQIDNLNKSQRVIEGILALGINLDFKRIEDELEGVSKEFNLSKDKIYKGIEESQTEMLRGLGISGSAVKPNMKENEDWNNGLQELRVKYDLTIEKLKERLMCQIDI